jgi:hypothetical protein
MYVDVAVLMTTYTEEYNRVSMHGVSLELVKKQAASLGLDLLKIPLPADCSNEIYEDRMAVALQRLRSMGILEVVFGDFLEMFGKLRPTIVVADSYPRKLQPTITRLDGATFLRLRDLKKLSEERRNNGLWKTDENDAKALRLIFYEAPGLFQPLYASPLELEVRALTELWVEPAGIKRAAKNTGTITDDPLAVETHKVLRRYTEGLATRIHERAMELPLYRMAVERLGLKGPALAYIISHDTIVFKTLSRTGLERRYEQFRRRWKSRGLRSQLLIGLAYATVTNRNQRYLTIYESCRQRAGAAGGGIPTTPWR